MATSSRAPTSGTMSVMPWELGAGVVELPDGVRLRGRSLRDGPGPGPEPDFGLYLPTRRPVDTPWRSRWIRWPDFWRPIDAAAAHSAFEEAYRLAAQGARVEVACRGGVGRTGTALACISQFDGVTASEATAWVRARYNRLAVETPWQRLYVRRFSARSDDAQRD